MIWLRCVGWFVFSLLLLSPIITAEGDEKIIIEDFDDIYYMDDTGSVEISTEITFVGDNLNDGCVPIEVVYYTEDGKILSSEEVNPNKVRTKVGMDGYNPVYEYHNYTASFGFETNLTGDIDLLVIVYLGGYSWHSEVYTLQISASFNPSDNPDDPTTQEVFFTSTVVIIFIIIIIVMTVMSIAARKVVRERRELSSKTSTGLEIDTGDTELDSIVQGVIDDDRLSISDDARDTRVLETHSEMNEVR